MGGLCTGSPTPGGWPTCNSDEGQTECEKNPSSPQCQNECYAAGNAAAQVAAQSSAEACCESFKCDQSEYDNCVSDHCGFSKSGECLPYVTEAFSNNQCSGNADKIISTGNGCGCQCKIGYTGPNCCKCATGWAGYPYCKRIDGSATPAPATPAPVVELPCKNKLDDAECEAKLAAKPELCNKAHNKYFKGCRGTCALHHGVRCAPDASLFQCVDTMGSKKCDHKFLKKKGRFCGKAKNKVYQGCRGTCNYWKGTPCQ